MAERLTIEHYVGECTLKCAQVILAARIPRKDAPNAPGERRSGRWFLLEVEEVAGLAKQLEAWRRDIYQPLVIEVFALNWNCGVLAGAHQQERTPLAGASTSVASEQLLERWSLRFGSLPLGALAGPSAGARAGGNDDAAVYKRMILLVRSLHSYVRILPAYRLFRAASKRHPGQTLQVHYRLSLLAPDGSPHVIYSSAPPPSAPAPAPHQAAPPQPQPAVGSPGHGPGRLRSSFAFSPVEAPGSCAMQVAVAYAPASTVHILEHAASPTPPSAPRVIIHDYVGARDSLAARATLASGTERAAADPAGSRDAGFARSAPGGGGGGLLVPPATAATAAVGAAGSGLHASVGVARSPGPLSSSGISPLGAGGTPGSAPGCSPLQLPRAASLRSPAVVRQSWGSREVQAHVVYRGFNAPGGTAGGTAGGGGGGTGASSAHQHHHHRRSSSGSVAGAMQWASGSVGAGSAYPSASALGTSPATSQHLAGRPPLPTPQSPISAAAASALAASGSAGGHPCSASPTTPLSLPRPSPLQRSSSGGAGGGPAAFCASPPTPNALPRSSGGGSTPAGVYGSAPGGAGPAAGLPPTGHRTPHGQSPHQSPLNQTARPRHVLHHHNLQQRQGGKPFQMPPSTAPAAIMQGFEPPSPLQRQGYSEDQHEGRCLQDEHHRHQQQHDVMANEHQGPEQQRQQQEQQLQGGGVSGSEEVSVKGSRLHGSHAAAASGTYGTADEPGHSAGTLKGRLVSSGGGASTSTTSSIMAGAEAALSSAPQQALAPSAPVAIPGRGGGRGRARSVTDLHALAGAGATGAEGGLSRAMARAAGGHDGLGRVPAGADCATSALSVAAAAGGVLDRALLLRGSGISAARGGTLAPSSAPAAPRGMLGQLLAQGGSSPLDPPVAGRGPRGSLLAEATAEGADESGHLASHGAVSSSPAMDGDELGGTGAAAESADGVDGKDDGSAQQQRLAAAAVLMGGPFSGRAGPIIVRPHLPHQHPPHPHRLHAGSRSPAQQQHHSHHHARHHRVLVGDSASGSLSGSPGAQGLAGYGPGGPLSSSPQLPFAFTPSGASVKSLVEQHRWGTAAAAAAALQGHVALAQGVLPPSHPLSQPPHGHGPYALPAPPSSLMQLGSQQGSQPGSQAGSQGGSGPLGLNHLHLQLPSPTAATSPSPPISGRDISALATIRRPSWSGRSASLSAAAAASVAAAAVAGSAAGGAQSPYLGQGRGGPFQQSGLGASPMGMGMAAEEEEDLLGGPEALGLGTSGDCGAEREATGTSDPGNAEEQRQQQTLQQEQDQEQEQAQPQHVQHERQYQQHHRHASHHHASQALAPDESESDVLPFALDCDQPAMAALGATRGAQPGAGASSRAGIAGAGVGVGVAGRERDLEVCAFIRIMQDAPPLNSQWPWGGGLTTVGDALLQAEQLVARLQPVLLHQQQ